MEIKLTVSEKINDLAIKYGLFFKNIKVFHNDQEIDSFESKAEAKKGKIIKLPNGQLITIKLKESGF